MSWSSDVRCLYCDGRLPLYRKITNGQFCSAPHRKLYWQEQERLCVERLNQTHDSLRAFRPPEGVQAILGAGILEQPPEQPVPAPEPPPPSGIIAQPVALKFAAPKFDTPPFVAEEPAAYKSEIRPHTPLWTPQSIWAPQIAAEEEVEAPGPVAELIRVYTLPQAQWPTDRLEAAAPNPLAASLSVRLPLRAAATIIRTVVPAGITKIPVAPRRHKSAQRAEPVSSVMLPCRDITLSASPKGGVLAEAGAEQDHIPRAEQLMALARFAVQISEDNARRDPWPAAPFAILQRAHLPLGTTECGITPALAMPVLAGLRPLSIDLVPLVHGTWIDSLRAMGSETESPRYELSTPAMRPRLRLAAGSRYQVATRDAAMTVATIEPENLLPSGKEVAIPERKAMSMSAAAGASSGKSLEIPAPGAAGLIPLASAKPNEPKAPQPAPTFNPPQPLWTEPRRPASHLEPIDAKPIADFITAPEPKDEPANVLEDLMPPGKGEKAAAAWTHVTGFWKHAPRDLKLLVFGIPILLALALHPSLKKIPYTAPAQAQAVGIQRGIEKT
ncbi:MAG: hypothetical protein ABSF22_09105, partial [Bryobacteraceae bacterium]